MAENPSRQSFDEVARTHQGSATMLYLLELNRRARMAKGADELYFLLTNATHTLTPYRQAALWRRNDRVLALSGVAEPDRNAPYVTWLSQLFKSIDDPDGLPQRVDASLINADLKELWAEWLPPHALCIPLGGKFVGALLLVRDQAFTDQEVALLEEWTQIWIHAWSALTTQTQAKRWFWRLHWHSRSDSKAAAPLRWYRRKMFWLALAIAIAMVIPVPISVLAPSELVPAQPVVIRSPIEGVIANFDVKPNAVVEKDQPLFSFDAGLIETRVQVARQALETALAQYRQTSQLALFDPKYKAELVAQAGQIEEKRSEFEYLKSQRQRAKVRSPIAGTVLFDDPSSWVGKPVGVGERILRIARTGDVEVESWLALADAIDLKEGDPVTLYLQADPLKPVYAKLYYFSHEAVLRPDGSYAYRIRARLEEGEHPRVGLKGTARISGTWTTMGYWLLRRPLASLRATLGY